jgi:hypothetical protein
MDAEAKTLPPASHFPFHRFKRRQKRMPLLLCKMAAFSRQGIL